MNINKKKNEHPYKIFGFFAILLIGLGIYIGVLIYKENTKQQDLYLETELESFTSKINSILATYEVFSKYIFEETVNKPQINYLMYKASFGNDNEKSKLRQELYLQLKNNYKNITKYNFRQLHFHLANGDSFLRFHSPENFGDNLLSIRDSIRRLKEEKRFIKGFEEGRIYNGYRFMYPIFYQKNYVGSVEVSISMQTLVEVVSDLYNEFDLFFIIDGDVINKIVFSDKINNYTKSPIFNGYYFDKEVKEISITKAHIFNDKKLEEFFKNTDIEKKLQTKENFSFVKNMGGKYYLAQFLSIKNINNKHVAYMISMSCPEQYRNIFNKYFSIFILVIFIITISIISSLIYIKDKNKLKILSNTDYLTKIFNRVRFMEIASYELNRVERSSSTFTVIIFDIDFFKKINDNYGHNIGDTVLIELCNLVSKNLRKTDIFARWGGEEFICLLPDTNIRGAYILSESLRKKVESFKFSHIEKITISLGLYQMKKTDTFIEDIIDKADKALYLSKNSGRNKTSIWLE